MDIGQNALAFDLESGELFEVPPGPWPFTPLTPEEYHCAGLAVAGEGICNAGPASMEHIIVFFQPLTCSYLPVDPGCFVGEVVQYTDWGAGGVKSTQYHVGTGIPLVEDEMYGERPGPPPVKLDLWCEAFGVGEFAGYWFVA